MFCSSGGGGGGAVLLQCVCVGGVGWSCFAAGFCVWIWQQYVCVCVCVWGGGGCFATSGGEVILQQLGVGGGEGRLLCSSGGEGGEVVLQQCERGGGGCSNVGGRGEKIVLQQWLCVCVCVCVGGGGGQVVLQAVW